MNPIAPAVKEEYEKQAKAYYAAMTEAVYSTAERFEMPISNSVMTALVQLMAERLAAVDDGRIRKKMTRELDQIRDKEIINLIARPDWKFSETAILGGHDA